MDFRVKKFSLGLAAVLLLGLATGCPNSTPASSGSATLAPNFVFNNVASRFDGFAEIQQIFIEPSDPGAAAALGDRDIGLLAAPVFIDVANPVIDSLFIVETPISEGAYNITGFRFGPINLFDSDFDVSGATTCGESQFFFDSFTPINVIDLANQPTVTVTRDADNLLNVNIDVNSLLTAFQDAFICTGGVNGSLGPLVPTNFANANGNYLSFD